MEKENQYILFYSLNNSDKFTSFLPLDLKDSKDKNLFDFLTDKSNDNLSNDQVFQLPLEQKNYDYLIKLQIENFSDQVPSDFFRKHDLEEWAL
jgi:hypothetical protein